eukprot:14063-Prorocentrum_minimum.AAC.2
MLRVTSQSPARRGEYSVRQANRPRGEETAPRDEPITRKERRIFRATSQSPALAGRRAPRRGQRVLKGAEEAALVILRRRVRVGQVAPEH